MSKTRLFCIAAVFPCVTSLHAQSVTYNHDSAKQGQVTVMETGAGSLSPELYYTLLHNSYKKTAAETNKLSYRTTAAVNLYGQIDDAEAIDSALLKRAEVEALNVADRSADIAWQTEGTKVTGKMEDFQKNINRIVPAGGDVADRQRWTEYYNMFDCAIQATKEAYMPNAQRKREYLHIYADLTAQNEILINYLVQLHTRACTSSLLSAADDRAALHKDAIAAEAMARWKNSGRVTGSTSGTGGNIKWNDELQKSDNAIIQ